MTKTMTKAAQAMEFLAAYPSATAEDVAELLAVSLTTARAWKARASGELPSRRLVSKYSKVREYIMAHPKAPAKRIAKVCGCTVGYVGMLLNPVAGPIAAEFGDIRKNHFRGYIKPLPLVVPPASKLAAAKPVVKTTIITGADYNRGGGSAPLALGRASPLTEPNNANETFRLRRAISIELHRAGFGIEDLKKVGELYLRLSAMMRG